MKKTFSILGFAAILFCAGCDKKTLSNEDVKKLLEESKAYPRAMEARVFINEEASARKIQKSDLEEQGLVTAQATHTIDDIGQSLVKFTDKAAPYMIAKKDSLESIEIQLVRVADESFSEVTSITYSEDGLKADVDYTVAVSNETPFAVLLNNKIKPVQPRKTSFTKTATGWSWDGEIKEL